MNKILIFTLFAVLLCSCENTYYYQLNTKDSLNKIEKQDKKKFKAKNDSIALDNAKIYLSGYISANNAVRKQMPEYGIYVIKLDVFNSNDELIGSVHNDLEGNK